jgi:hypothetical protein
MILVPILALVTEDQVWLELGLQGLEEGLDLVIGSRKAPIRERLEPERPSVPRRNEPAHRSPALPTTYFVTAQHDPTDTRPIPASLKEPQGGAAADLDVIAMRSDTEHFELAGMINVEGEFVGHDLQSDWRVRIERAFDMRARFALPTRRLTCEIPLGHIVDSITIGGSNNRTAQRANS